MKSKENCFIEVLVEGDDIEKNKILNTSKDISQPGSAEELINDSLRGDSTQNRNYFLF